jgi:ATP-dependent DNA ligase
MKNEKMMLAQAGDEKQIEQMIASGNWHFERKYDGERGLLRVELCNGIKTVGLYNRSGKPIGDQFPELIDMALRLPFGTYDGEIYVPDNAGNKDKPTTAGRTNVRAKEARYLCKTKPARFMCFDVLVFDGKDIEAEPYEVRKEALSRADRVAIADELPFEGVYPEEDPKQAWDEIVKGGDEGMVAKRVGSPYQHLRSPDWVKLKTWKEEDFEVIGITSEKREISALVLNDGMKVNCALDADAYTRLLSDLIKTDEVLKCSDGTLAIKLKKTYKAKIKFLSKSETGLRFPILHELEGF